MITAENIINLFPTCAAKGKLERDFTAKEMKHLKPDDELDMRPNEGNRSSKNNYILDLPVFKKLKKELEIATNEYFQTVWMPKTDCSVYITQSWLNTTTAGQYHHKHEHPNSFISGVLYIDADVENDRIQFFAAKPYQQLTVDPKEFTYFNSSSWWLSVESRDIMLFPSSLTHMVTTKNGENTRTSLAFNTFLRGVWGDNQSLTEMKLP
jgi:uncharacterized protein (TIGR02466 family)